MRKSLYICLAVGSTWFLGCQSAVNFSRERQIDFKQIVSIPDEAVIYMQNLALMKDQVEVKDAEHVELLLPPRLIIESLQVEANGRNLAAFNIQSKGDRTLIRIRDVRKYLSSSRKLKISYLTWGLHWRAQYRVELLNDGKTRLQLGAMVHNQWFDLSNTKVTLVAGWVGVSSSRRRFSSLLKPGLPIASVGSQIPSTAWPRKQRGRRIARRQSSQRALSETWVRKYRIKKVDKTYQFASSNFKKQFSQYYKTNGQRVQNTQNRVYGYALYKGLHANLKKGEESYMRVAGDTVQAKLSYLWPADKGDKVFAVYKIKNHTKFLFPAGAAWLYRDGVFIGEDLCHWTPIGAKTYLTTSNDGSIFVRKNRMRMKNDMIRTELSVRNLTDRSLTVEVFEKNPESDSHGTLTFSIEPKTMKQKERFHRWIVTLKAHEIKTIRMDFLPTPPKVPVQKKKKTEPHVKFNSKQRTKKLLKQKVKQRRMLRRRRKIRPNFPQQRMLNPNPASNN